MNSEQFGNAVNVEVIRRCAEKLFNYESNYEKNDHNYAQLC